MRTNFCLFLPQFLNVWPHLVLHPFQIRNAEKPAPVQKIMRAFDLRVLLGIIDVKNSSGHTFKICGQNRLKSVHTPACYTELFCTS